MKIILSFLQICIMLIPLTGIRAQKADQNSKLRIIIIGAHPDDPDKVGGTAFKWAQLGHDVLMVSLTNGDAGHQSVKPKELAKIRLFYSPTVNCSSTESWRQR